MAVCRHRETSCLWKKQSRYTQALTLSRLLTQSVSVCGHWPLWSVVLMFLALPTSVLPSQPSQPCCLPLSPRGRTLTTGAVSFRHDNRTPDQPAASVGYSTDWSQVYGTLTFSPLLAPFSSDPRTKPICRLLYPGLYAPTCPAPSISEKEPHPLSHCYPALCHSSDHHITWA